jgi:hypothetical protein
MEGRPSNRGRLVGNFPQAFTHLALLKIPVILGIEGASRASRSDLAAVA